MMMAVHDGCLAPHELKSSIVSMLLRWMAWAIGVLLSGNNAAG